MGFCDDESKREKDYDDMIGETYSFNVRTKQVATNNIYRKINSEKVVSVLFTRYVTYNLNTMYLVILKTNFSQGLLEEGKEIVKIEVQL